MGANTEISWLTDALGNKGATWPIVVGCDKVSDGCAGCWSISTSHVRAGHPNPKISAVYAGTTHRVDGRTEWTGQVNVIQDRLPWPLTRKKPTQIFPASSGDLFHALVPDDFIHQVFAVMAATPQHTYKILTKRPARMRSLLNDVCKCGGGHAPGVHFRSAMEWAATPHSPTYVPGLEPGLFDRMTWPLPNVWIGVSIEDQKTADRRVPELIKTPAAVRWLSAEPLLGPIDLSAWMPPRLPVAVDDAPRTWSEFTWPDWVPAEARAQIEEFWSPALGRGPRTWLRDAIEQGAPAFGQRWRSPSDDRFFGHHQPGRYIHAWNNVGRLALDDGSMASTSFARTPDGHHNDLHWLVYGGESGHRARPMHPNWARSLRDQCLAAGVPQHLKQWGEWGPAPWSVKICDPKVGWTGTDEELAAAKAKSEAEGATHSYAEWAHLHGWELYQPPHKPWSLERVNLSDTRQAPMRRWGKKDAGRELDGRTWDEHPTARTPERTP